MVRIIPGVKLFLSSNCQFHVSFSGVVRFLLGVENCVLLFQVYVSIMCKLRHFSNCLYSTDNVLCIYQLKKTPARRLKRLVRNLCGCLVKSLSLMCCSRRECHKKYIYILLGKQTFTASCYLSKRLSVSSLGAAEQDKHPLKEQKMRYIVDFKYLEDNCSSRSSPYPKGAKEYWSISEGYRRVLVYI